VAEGVAQARPNQLWGSNDARETEVRSGGPATTDRDQRTVTANPSFETSKHSPEGSALRSRTRICAYCVHSRSV
jgi:hypothetical protein